MTHMTTPRLLILLFSLAWSFLAPASGFSSKALPSVTTQSYSKNILSAAQSRVTSSLTRSRNYKISRLYSSPDDKQAEIAALEEKLRQLKQEASQEGDAPISPPSTAVSTIAPESEEDAVVDNILREKESEDSVMFSERWKESDPTQNNEEGSMGGLAKAGLALGLIAFLAVFSQIPVGQEDLQRYQDTKGNSARIDLGDLNPDARVQ